jgi:heat shock protein HtpX
LNLLEQQAANRRRTWLVIVLFILVLGLLGAGLDLYAFGGPVATPVALLIGGGSAWVSYLQGDKAILASSHAEPLDERMTAATEDDHLRYQQLRNVVEEVAIASGLPVPAIYIIPDDDPNAFATGRGPERASLAVTEGLLRRLNREELQGVVAHEMGHIRNLDIRLLMIVSALVGAVVLLAAWSRRSMGFGSGSRRNGKSGGAAFLVLLAIWLVAAILAPIAARLMAMAISRQREYLADATSAELTRNPLALASALKKIDADVAPTASISQGAAALCIADPTGSDANDREGHWANLWATHPPIAKRIAALDAMAYQKSAS